MARSWLAVALVAIGLAGCFANAPESESPLPLSLASPLPLSLEVFETGFRGYEPSIGVDVRGRVFVGGAGDSQNLGTDLVIRSDDEGASWAMVDAFAISSDPILHLDPLTQRVYRAHMFGTLCTNLAWSDDGGATWVQRPLACGAGLSNDFIKLGSGRPGPADPVPAGVDHVLYLCHNRNPGSMTVCAMSRDGGLTWPMESVAAEWDRDGAGGVTSFPAVSANGTVVVPVNGGGRFAFAVSRDSGAAWQVRHLPFVDGVRGEDAPTPRMAFDGNTAYALWTTIGHLWLGRSDDLATWTRVEVAPANVSGFTHLGMDVVGPGSVAYAFLGSSSKRLPWEAEPGTEWRLHAGVWAQGALHQAVGEIAHIGRICYGGSDCPRNLGDFFDASAGPDGSLWYSFVDGCDECGESQATGGALKVARVRLPG